MGLSNYVPRTMIVPAPEKFAYQLIRKLVGMKLIADLFVRLTRQFSDIEPTLRLTICYTPILSILVWPIWPVLWMWITLLLVVCAERQGRRNHRFPVIVEMEWLI